MSRMFYHFIICFTLLMLCFSTVASIAQKTYSVPKPKYDSVIKLKDSLRKTDSTKALALKAAGDSSKPQRDTSFQCGCIPNLNGVAKPEGVVLSFLPALLFVGLLIWLMSKGLKDFSLKQAMSENMYPAIRVDNPQYTAANLTAMLTKENLDEILPPTIEITNLKATTTTTTNTDAQNVTTKTVAYESQPPNPSISRYIAFITSILTLVVALGISCFYIYHYVRTGCPPELTGISTLLIALGIGVLPYMANKVSGAIGKSKVEAS